jgi:energy-coupling factor transporter ATP-binding protein EcfA2
VAERPVPDQVLHAPETERLLWFHDRLLDHEMLNIVFKQVRQAIAPPAVAPLVLLLGPTGVGKSRLLLKLLEQVLTEAREAMIADRSIVPIAGTLMSAPETGSFDWKACYISALKALGEPLVEYKRDPLPDKTARSDPLRVWRESFKNALHYRKAHVFFFDEAQHLLKVSGRRYVDQMDALKSVAIECQVPLILAGTYQLLELADRSDQLSRRRELIHFARYDAHNKRQLKEFKTFILTIQSFLPVENPPDLLKDWDYLYEKSLGVCGVLYDWMIRALKASYVDGKPFSIDHLKGTVRRQKEINKAWHTIVNGERDLRDARATPGLRAALGLDTPQAKDSEKGGRKSGGNRHPGQRKPGRDQVPSAAATS